MDRHRIALLGTGALVYACALVAGIASGQGFSIEGIAFLAGGPIYATVGIIILLHRPGHRIGRLLLLLGIALSITAVGPFLLDALSPVRWVIGPLRIVLELLVAWSGSIAILVGTILVLVWFPDGRTSSRLGRAIELGCLLLVAITMATSLSGEGATNVAAFLMVITLFVLSLVEIGIRTRRAAPRERAAMHYVFASALVVTLFMVGVLTIGNEVPFLWSFWVTATILPAIAVAIAIRRHHLYDIDRLISRSIAYTIVTLVLVAVFSGVGITVQWLLSPWTRGETIVVAASTLVVATLFAPLRSRVQGVVDRRFDRGRYDAARTVEAYAGRLRDELDLMTLTADLRRVTTSTVQPTSTGVWLRTSGPR